MQKRCPCELHVINMEEYTTSVTGRYANGFQTDSTEEHASLCNSQRQLEQTD